ncbi:MAG: hypothetical protein AB2697_17440 [Candidatus Thiodiazotropha endolucinida]
MDILQTIIVGILASLSASIVFLFAMFQLKPKITISPLIAREEQDGKTIFGFKVVNMGKRPVVNLKAEVVFVKGTNVEGGPMFWLKPVSLNKDNVFYLSGYSKSDPNADYALRLSTDDDIDHIWDSHNDFLEINVYAVDSLSGFGSAVRQEFRTKRNCIMAGSHKWGKDLDVC